MAKIIAIANQKGGVGKTTSSVNLSAALCLMGKKVLLVDCDPQGNASSGMGVLKTTRPNTYDMLIGGKTASECVSETEYGDVIPASKELAAASVELINADRREYVLKDKISALYSEYDYIFIDCPPSLELLTVNALVASDSVLIPMQCEYYALEGIADLLTSIKMCSRRLNRRLGIEGIVLTMYDKRKTLHRQIYEAIQRSFGGMLFSSAIRNNIAIAEAPATGRLLYDYAPKSNGAADYRALTAELLQRMAL